MGSSQYCSTFTLNYFPVFVGEFLSVRALEAGDVTYRDYLESGEDFHSLYCSIAPCGCYQDSFDS